MKLSIIAMFAFVIGLSPSFAEETVMTAYDLIDQTEEIEHEMIIGCVSKKSECTTLAHHQGYNTSRTMKDAARCPNRPKTLACIVKH